MFHVDDAGHGKWRGTIHGAWRWHTSIDVVDTGELLELAHEEVFHFLMRHEQTAHEDAAIGFWNSETKGCANISLYNANSQSFSDVESLPPQGSAYIVLMLMVPKDWKQLKVTYVPTFLEGKSLTFVMNASDVIRS